MIAIKALEWDFETHAYHDRLINEESALYETDMSKIVKCANCAKSLRFGDCYTSRKIHNQAGLGFAVCEQCYNQEWEEERNAPKKD